MDDWPQILLRFLHYVILFGLFGAIAYRLVGQRWLSAEAQPKWLDGGLVALLLRHSSRIALQIAATLYGLAVASLSLSGYAAALEGGAGLFHRINDTVHLRLLGFGSER